MNNFLDGKRFLLGDTVCDEDASVFGTVSQFVYAETGTLNQFIESN